MGSAFQSTPVTLRWPRFARPSKGDGPSAGAGHTSRPAKARAPQDDGERDFTVAWIA